MTINECFVLRVHGSIGEDDFSYGFDYVEIDSGTVAPLPPTARLGAAFMQEVMPAIRDITGSDCILYGLSIRNHPRSNVKAPTAWLYDLEGQGDVTAVQSMPVDGALCVKGYTTALPRRKYSRTYIRGIAENFWDANSINFAFWASPITALLTALNAPLEAGVTGGSSGTFRRALVYHPDGTPEENRATQIIASHALTNTPSRQRRGETVRTGVFDTPGVGTISDAGVAPDQSFEEDFALINDALIPPFVEIEEP